MNSHPALHGSPAPQQQPTVSPGSCQRQRTSARRPWWHGWRKRPSRCVTIAVWAALYRLRLRARTQCTALRPPWRAAGYALADVAAAYCLDALLAFSTTQALLNNTRVSSRMQRIIASCVCSSTRLISAGPGYEPRSSCENASCGTSTLPMRRIFFLPAACLERSFCFLDTSPP